VARFASEWGKALSAAYRRLRGHPEQPHSEVLTAQTVLRIYVPAVAGDRIRQGEILENLPQSKLTLESLRQVVGWTSASSQPKPGLTVNFAEHPLVIVVAPDCDLEQDGDSREKSGKGTLSDFLLCDVYYASSLKAKHGKSLKEWKVVAENQSPRFQFLTSVKPEEDARGKGLPSLAIDFKHHFTMPADEVYERLSLRSTTRISVLTSPYVEHLSQRFYSFQSRVPLPMDHPTDEG
jgi:hypothetical protein